MSGLTDKCFTNEMFNSDDYQLAQSTKHFDKIPANDNVLPGVQINDKQTVHQGHETWGKDIEFLLSCISLSVGLGNVWRFPFTALENGGGAFVIPYLIVLFLVGKPVYYLEMVMGQFSNRGSIKIFQLAPAMRGVGYGQVFSTLLATTYYASIMALTLRYFFASFNSVLPWTVCQPEWGSNCVDLTTTNLSVIGNHTNLVSSAELYFLKEVLKEKSTIDDGIGFPDWKLTLCLFLSWTIVTAVIIKGVKSSGKASYFLALFPYVIMIILLIRAVTLDGAIDGIIYFLKPQWDKILEPQVWYAAVTQVFFSLAICFGSIVMYSSYNRFDHNLYRDATIVTALDTFTSLLAGITIFGVLGNLAKETNASHINEVVNGGAGLAFISYPNAITKFKEYQQIFSILFFFMLFVLGIGSNVGMVQCVVRVIRDQFSRVTAGQAAIGIACIQFLVGLIYITPGGQFMLQFVDYFGCQFIAFILAIAELATFGWIYGVKRLCGDIEFMLKRKTGFYWRICWGFVTPIMMTIILIYTLVTLKPLQYKNYTYPDAVYAIGWCISAIGILQLPIWAIYTIYITKGNTLTEKIVGAFRPKLTWGPRDSCLTIKYRQFCSDRRSPQTEYKRRSILMKFWSNLFN